MHRCLALAERGRGKVGANPLVGAALIRGGKIIAEAWHHAFGDLHAERQLLAEFDQKIYSGDILYVNLEPCCHHGKTPPCTAAILERGIRHVVFGMRDPNPVVAGKGIALLEQGGVHVEGPVERASCERANRGFLSVVALGRPYVTLRSAQTVDGRVAKPNGEPLKITCRQQDLWTHRFLRARHDAILVGIGTVLRDNPRLTARYSNKKIDHYDPLRIVLDANLRIPLSSKIVSGGFAHGTLVVSSPIRGGEQRGVAQELRSRGVWVEEVPVRDGVFDWCALWSLLVTPKEGFSGITSVLLEGGPSTWEAFRRAGFVDEEVTLVGHGATALSNRSPMRNTSARKR